MADRECVGGCARGSRSLPDNCRDEVLGSENFIKDYPRAMLLVIVEMHPHRTVLGKNRFEADEAVVQDVEPRGMLDIVAIVAKPVARVERRIDVGELHPTNVGFRGPGRAGECVQRVSRIAEDEQVVTGVRAERANWMETGCLRSMRSESFALVMPHQLRSGLRALNHELKVGLWYWWIAMRTLRSIGNVPNDITEDKMPVCSIAPGRKFAIDTAGLMRQREEMDDAYNLERFVAAQDRDGVYDQAVKELRAGRKQTGWMWFVFPQMQGLGYTQTALHFGITSREEAAAYLAHDVLGPRLRRCTQLVLRSGAATATTLMGGDVNAKKLKSSMTLFAAAADDNGDFLKVLRKYYHAGRDLQTLKMLKQEPVKPEIQSENSPKPSRRWFRLWRRDET